MSDFQLPPLSGFGEWGPSCMKAKAPVVYNQAVPLRASLWYDQDAARPDQESREAFLNSVFTKAEQVALSERLVAYVKEIKDGETATKRTQFEKTPGSRFNNAAKDQFHEATIAIDNSKIKGHVAIDSLWAPKASFAPPTKKTVLHTCGRPPLYNPDLEKAKFSNSIPLREGAGTERVERTGITGDEMIAECVSELSDYTGTIVVTSDEVLACIMATPASVNTWDVEIMTSGNLIFIDRREGGNTDKEWVNENATGDELPSDTADEDNLDSREHLGKESTNANFAFNLQCASKGVFQISTEPLLDKDTHARKIMYKYVDYLVNEGLPNEFHLIVRTEVDAAEKAVDGSMKPYRSFAFLDYTPAKPTRSYRPNPNVAWTDSSSLAVLLVDVARKNSGKAARWIAMSYFSDAMMKIGFITRKGETSKTHAIGGVFTISPTNFASAINIDISKFWSALSTVVEAIQQSGVEDGGILRQGGEKQLRIFYNESNDSGDDDSDDDDSNDDDSDDDEDESDDEDN